MAKCLRCGEIVPDGSVYCSECQKGRDQKALHGTVFFEPSAGLSHSGEKPFVLDDIGTDYKPTFSTNTSFADSGLGAKKMNSISPKVLVAVCAVLAVSVAALIIILTTDSDLSIPAPSSATVLSEPVASQQSSSQSSAAGSPRASVIAPGSTDNSEQSEAFEGAGLSAEEQRILSCLYDHYLSYLDAINEFEPSLVSYCTDLHRETCDYRIRNYNDENVFRFTSITADISTLRIYTEAGMTLAEVLTRVDYKYADRNTSDRVWESGGNIQWFYFKKENGKWLVNYAEQTESQQLSSNTVTMK